MLPLYSTNIKTDFGDKEISVYSSDILYFDKEIDILTTSAYVNSYHPTPHTMFEALNNVGISVYDLSRCPEIDLRIPCYTWLSKYIQNPNVKFHRIGCVELVRQNLRAHNYWEIEQSMINSIRAYFAMLDIADIYGIKMETIALPLLGSGSQGVSAELLIVPILNECISFLKRNASVKRIYFIERNQFKAQFISEYIQKSYSLSSQQKNVLLQKAVVSQNKRLRAFISYSSNDRNIADNLCAKLESRGVQVWYAPRNVKDAYAESIVEAIDQSTHFIVILSENSMKSQHVLNEIDLAFQALPNHIKFKPLRIDESMFTPSFKYYLSRQHWMDATIPPLEERLNEFVNNLISDI